MRDLKSFPLKPSNDMMMFELDKLMSAHSESSVRVDRYLLNFLIFDLVVLCFGVHLVHLSNTEYSFGGATIIATEPLLVFVLLIITFIYHLLFMLELTKLYSIKGAVIDLSMLLSHRGVFSLFIIHKGSLLEQLLFEPPGGSSKFVSLVQQRIQNAILFLGFYGFAVSCVFMALAYFASSLFSLLLILFIVMADITRYFAFQRVWTEALGKMEEHNASLEETVKAADDWLEKRGLSRDDKMILY